MPALTKEELLKSFIQNIEFIAGRTKRTSVNVDEAVDSTIHAILTLLDGVGNYMPTPITLVAVPHDDDDILEYIEEGSDYVNDCIEINDDVYLHDLWGEVRRSVPAPPFYPKIIQRYHDMLTGCENKGRFPESPYLSHGHLLKMLDEIKNNSTQSPTKKHRWLGYVQHALIVAGITSVDAERDFTRDIFNGQ